MVEIVAVVLLNIFLWIACAGVGHSVLRIPPRHLGGSHVRADSERTTVSWGISACVGLALLVAIGGVGMLLRVPVLVTYWLFISVGAALALWSGILRRRVKTPATRVYSVALVIVVGFMLVTQASAGLSMVPNNCDDLLAYIPMADRLLETGRIVEPWSYRRLQNLGGISLLQALPIGVLGRGAFGSFDTLTASIFLAGLFVSPWRRAHLPRVLSIIAVLLVAVMTVPRANSSAVLLVAPLLVACYMCVSELRRALTGGYRATAFRWAGAAGLLVAACLVVRLNLAATPAAVLVAGVFSLREVSRRTRLQALALATGSSSVAAVAWMIGSWQSSGTPLFPLLAGNLNRSVPNTQDPELTGLLARADRSLELLFSGPNLAITLMVLALTILVRRRLPNWHVLAIASVATLITMLVTAASLTLAAEAEFVRYLFPLPVALVILFVCQAIETLERSNLRRASSGQSPALVVVLALVCISYGFGLFNSEGWKTIGDRFEAIGDVVGPQNRRRAILHALDPKGLDAHYKTVLAIADARGRTIAAVDRPYLIDYASNDVPSLDMRGWAAPGGQFPTYEGALAKVTTLREQGFDSLLATTPSVDVCMDPTLLRRAVGGKGVGTLQSSYWLDWQIDVETIASVAPEAVDQVGSLLLIDLEQAVSSFERAAPPRPG